MCYTFSSIPQPLHNGFLSAERIWVLQRNKDSSSAGPKSPANCSTSSLAKFTECVVSMRPSRTYGGNCGILSYETSEACSRGGCPFFQRVLPCERNTRLGLKTMEDKGANDLRRRNRRRGNRRPSNRVCERARPALCREMESLSREYAS